MTSHDQLSKSLIKLFFTDFLRLIEPEAAPRLQAGEATFLDKEDFTDWPVGDRREMDLLAKVPVEREELPLLVHVEIETDFRSGMDHRLWQYYMMLRLRHGLPVLPVLVNLRGGRPGVHRGTLREGFDGQVTAVFHYRELGLSGCRAEEWLARPEPIAWAFAALMRPGSWSRAELLLEFVLDATPPGHLMTYSLADPVLPSPSGAIVPVPVGPFSGVSAAAGIVVVSGGTSELTLREYDRNGRFGTDVATADFGRGQPDVALRPDGRMAAISTHLYGPEFAVTFAEVRRQPLGLRTLGQLGLKDAGFTTGGFKPAHFPLVAAWRGDRVYLADGGGLGVIDAADPRQPRLLVRDRWPQPAIDVTVSGEELDVLRAGSQPAVVRYRLDGSGLPAPIGIWTLPAGHHPAAIARSGVNVLITQHERGWQTVPPTDFSPLSAN